jgi:RNA polymerase sigma-70 factor (ECF subfamily)
MPQGELLGECVRAGSPAAWEEFIRRFNPVITRVAIRTAARFGETSRQVIDDLVQETYLKICANDCRLLKNNEFREPEAIFGFLKVVAANVVHDYFKASRAQKRGAGHRTEELEESNCGASASKDNTGSATQMEREILIKEIDRRLRESLTPSESKRSRMVFWLYYRVGLPASAIAALPSVGLTTKGVESLLFRLTGVIREALIRESPAASENPKKGIRKFESFY